MNPSERRALLDACFPLMRRHEELTEQLELQPRLDRTELARTSEELRRLWNDYIQAIPTLPLVRCPFTKQLFAIPFDSQGIDGLWWNFDRPLRPDLLRANPHFHALKGAVRPAEDNFPVAPFLAVPGPEKPYLISRLMELPGMRAVMSALPLGNMTAYPIVYFIERPLPDDERSNDWGTNSFSYVDERGALHQGTGFDAEDMFDYKLKPWIDAGKLLWITPGDKEFALREGLRDCPFLDLPGKQAVWRLREGERWFGPEVT